MTDGEPESDTVTAPARPLLPSVSVWVFTYWPWETAKYIANPAEKPPENDTTQNCMNNCCCCLLPFTQLLLIVGVTSAQLMTCFRRDNPIIAKSETIYNENTSTNELITTINCADEIHQITRGIFMSSAFLVLFAFWIYFGSRLGNSFWQWFGWEELGAVIEAA